MRIAGFQIDIKWHDRNFNHLKIWRVASEAREKGADIFVLPEMCSTGFSMDIEVTAEPLNGPTPELFRTIAKETGMYVIGGFALAQQGRRPRNVSLAVDPMGRDLALYAKIHQIAILDEHNHYEPGSRPVTFSCKGTQATCFVCYDLRFPEIFRAVVDECQLIFVIASWPASRQSHWDALVKARAIESQCYVVGVNRTGFGGELEFTGGSAIIDPLGNTLVHAGKEEGLAMADIDPARVEEVRAAMPFLKDRIPDLALRR